LQGFTYSHFGGVSDSFNASISAETAAERTVDELLAWLNMQESKEEAYIPQPYEQLAMVLSSLGQDAKANQIMYAKNEYRRTHSTTSIGDKTWLAVKKIVIGYGYQIWLTVVWLFALVGFGAVVIRCSKEGRGVGTTEAVLYSLDQAIPLVSLQPSHEDIARSHSLRLRSYFLGHQIISLILLSFLGAGLAGAIG
jgi:hypothetical protein